MIEQTEYLFDCAEGNPSKSLAEPVPQHVNLEIMKLNQIKHPGTNLLNGLCCTLFQKSRTMKNFARICFGVFIVLFGCNNPCDNVSCLNGGICVDGTCNCPDGFTGEDCSTEVTPTPLNACDNESTFNYHGVDYNLVDINGFCWFKENLRTTKFTNGALIQEVNYPSQFVSLDQPAYYDLAEVNEGYGYLYNQYVIRDIRNVCPNGWHVSTDNDWFNLEHTIGMSPDDIYDFEENSTRGLFLARSIKSTENDMPSWDGDNNTGLSLVPSGQIFSGMYSQIDNDLDRPHQCMIWTSDDYFDISGHFICRMIYSNSGSDVILRKSKDENTAMAVRCVKDL